ncbi:MAG: ATP-binding protein [Gammaproteobacteria bacterium]|nr:ATP-binding protein [Gammaproteobacteria bacterium]
MAAVISYFDTHHEVEQILDARLAQAAQVLYAISNHQTREYWNPRNSEDKGEIVALSPRGGHVEYQENLAFQVWFNKAILVMRSEKAPILPLTRVLDGYSDITLDGVGWRIYAVQSADEKIAVQVGERYDTRADFADAVVMRTLWPLLLSLPILSMFIWFGIGWGLSSLDKIAKEMNARNPGHLEPLGDSDVPMEAKPLTDAINHMFEDLRGAFEQERRFTADAAHELRTPLAALKTQAEVALQAKGDADAHQALRKVLRGVNRATHLVEQLLTLARLDPQTAATDVRRFDLFILAEDVLSDLVPTALEKQIEVSLSGTRGKFVRANRDAIRVLLRNLVDNAIRYTPEQGLIEVALLREDEIILLRVADSGPGIPADERDKVFKRFYRLLGTKATGSGLGLSIVRRIAELHQLRVNLETSSYGGLEVDVRFGAEDVEAELHLPSLDKAVRSDAAA